MYSAGGEVLLGRRWLGITDGFYLIKMKMGQQNFPKFFAFFSSTMSLEGKLRQNLLLIHFNNRENKTSSVTVFCYYSVT